MTDKFRAAGEFYGHLLTELDSGTVAMKYQEQIFTYWWRYKINNKYLSAKILLTDAELMQTRFLGDLAKEVAAGWRREIKEPRG